MKKLVSVMVFDLDSRDGLPGRAGRLGRGARRIEEAVACVEVGTQLTPAQKMDLVAFLRAL
jgi:hypothetical protein